MAATDATAIPIKNQAFRVTFPILDNDGDLVTGATGLDSEVSKDAGTFTDCTNEATEIATASGVYYLDLTATEMNADTVVVIVKTTSTDAKTTTLIFYPAENADVKVNVVAWNGSNVASPHTAGYPVVTIKDGTGTGEIDTNAGAVPVHGDLSATMKASVNTEVNNALNTAIPGSPTADSMNERVKALDDNFTATVAGRIDVAVSTRSSHTAADVWASATRTLTSYGTLVTDIVAAVWAALTSGLTTAGSIGKLLVDNINATISSRATQTSVDDLPTNAELATALGTADDAVLAAIAALNNLGSADVQAAAEAALAAKHLDHLIVDTGTVLDLGSNTTIYFDAQLANNTATGQHSGNILVFTSGANIRIAKRINVLNATGGVEVGVNFQDVTSEKLPVAPSAGDTFIILAMRDEKMRGTDSAALASVCTSARLSELDAANIPADIDTLKTRIPGVVQPQTGDSYARIGAPSGASVSADIAAVKAETASIQTDTNSIETKVDTLVTNVAAILDDTGTSGVVLTAAERTAIADALLSRDMSLVSGVALDERKVLNALRALRNKVTIIGTTITVYKEDDTTVAWTGTITTDAAADPITAVDPA